MGKLPYQTTKSSTMQSTTIPVKESLIPSIRISGNEMPTSFVEEGSQRVPASKTDANLPARRVRTMQLPLEQRGHVATSATTTTTTTTTNLYPSEHVVTSSLTTITNTSPGVVTSSTTNPFQGRGETQVVNTAEDPQSLEVNDQSLILQDQSNQQVTTNLSISLSDMLYVSRPISSVGTVDQGKLPADGHAYIPGCGKAPPIDPFNAEDIGITFDDWLGEDIGITFDDWLPILERAAIWNEYTRRVTKATGWPLKRASITRIEVTVARRKNKLSSCYKSIKRKNGNRESNFGSFGFSSLITETE